MRRVDYYALIPHTTLAKIFLLRSEAGWALPADSRLHDVGEHRLRDSGRPEVIFQLLHPDLSSEFPPLKRAIDASGRARRAVAISAN